MKEGQGIIPGTDSDKVVIVGQNEKKFEVKKWQIKQHKGHTLYEINLSTGDVKVAEYEQTDLQINDMGPQLNMHVQAVVVGKAIAAQEIKKKLITKPNCIYISALNITNAAKKFATQSALKWWKEISDNEQQVICQAFFPSRNRHTIQNNEIEKLWNMENKMNNNG